MEVHDESASRETSLAERFRNLVLVVIDRHPSVLLDLDPLFEVVLFKVRRGDVKDMPFSAWDTVDPQLLLQQLYSFRSSSW